MRALAPPGLRETIPTYRSLVPVLTADRQPTGGYPKIASDALAG